MTQGRNLIVSIDGVAIAGAKSCSFEISQDFIKACPPTSGRVMNKIPTTYDWSMSVDCLIPSSALSVSLVDKLIAGTRVLLTFTDGSGNNRAGYAYVKSCNENGPVGSLAKFSASFESDGDLYKYTVYAVDDFTEGDRFEVRVNTGGTVTYIFNQSGTSTLGVQIATTQACKAIILADDSWVLYQEEFDVIKEAIDKEDEQVLGGAMIDCGAQPKTVQLAANTTYTVLENFFSRNYKIIVLY